MALARLRPFYRILVATIVIGLPLVMVKPITAPAASYVPVTGAGSTWSANAIDAWVADVKQYGMVINFQPVGSTQGRQDYLNQTVDFAASDIPFQTTPDDGSAPENPTPGTYAYIPVTAGGTTFMYNLTINGQRVTDLRLSGENIAKIFTGQVTSWNDPAIQADNPQLDLPDTPIIPVVRSDGAGSTAQFTMWMINQYPSIWQAYCNRTGRAPECGETSFYPTIPGMIAQSGDLGVAGYVSQGFANGAIGYVEYSYALNARFPVAEMLNAAGYYTEPTPDNVAVSLLDAQINMDQSNPAVYLTQNLDNVYTDTDPRVYPLSSYSYLIIPTTVQGDFSDAKGYTLSSFAYYAMCQGQQEMGSLGYSPMPVNLVQDAFQQITKIPGAVAQNINIQSCNNPTFTTSGTNLLATQDPMPPACAKQGPTQCAAGTAGDTTPTQLIGGSTSGSSGSSSSSGSSGSSGSGSSGGSSGGGGGSSGSGSSGSSGGQATVGSGSSGSASTGASDSSGTGSGGTSGSVAVGTSSSGSSSGASSASDSEAAALGLAPNSSSSGTSSGSSDGSSSGYSASNAQSQAVDPSAVTLGERGGGTELLVGLCCLLAVGVILVPGLISRHLHGPKR